MIYQNLGYKGNIFRLLLYTYLNDIYFIPLACTEFKFQKLHLGLMNAYAKQNLFFGLGFLAALGMLLFKIKLYDLPDYQADLFGILQLSRDYVLGKPLLYENAYGDNSGIHNYYLMPLLAPFTLLFGGKGLFLAGFAFQCWMLVLLARIFSKLQTWMGILFLLLLFAPVSWYIWDNLKFGWHAESFYLPLSLIAAASLLLGNKAGFLVSAIFLVLNREDGVWIVFGLYALFTFLDDKQSPNQKLKKITLSLLLSIGIFAAGILLLYLRGKGETRAGDAWRLFQENLQQYSLSDYLGAAFLSWMGIAGTAFLLCLALIKNNTGRLVGLMVLLPVLGISLYSGIYYFPDLKYGITWAPRLSGTYGFILSVLLISLYNKKIMTKAKGLLWIGSAILIFVIQYQSLLKLSYQPYSLLTRVQLSLGQQSEKVPDEPVKKRLIAFSAMIPKQFPLRMDEELFALFDHTDMQWPRAIHKPFKPARMLISKHISDADVALPLPFMEAGKIGNYRIFMDRSDQTAMQIMEVGISSGVVESP